MLHDRLLEYVYSPEIPETNYNLAEEYYKIGQTAAAISYYLRCSERTNSLLLQYECLLKIGQCFKKQGNRTNTVRGMYLKAISLLPNRPEAYYLLSLLHEHNGLFSDSYTTAVMGLQHIGIHDPLKGDVGYPGDFSLLFQKAVAAWWWGKPAESRALFKELLDNHLEEMDEVHVNALEKNLMNLGTGPESQALRKYTSDKHKNLSFKFEGSDNIKENYSQCFQDLFVLAVLNGKKNGSFLEVGGAGPFKGNNTALLELDFGWKGVSIEFDEGFAKDYSSNRKGTEVICKDALKIDYHQLLRKHFKDKRINYLQLDIEPARSTLECLYKIPFDEYTFDVITYEHDNYVDVTKSCREKSREYLRSKGYILVAGNISPDNKSPFEDWWVHSTTEINPLMINNNKDVLYCEDYMLSGSKVSSEIKINNDQQKRAFIVDDFYKDPMSVREFALNQNYIDGGFGRGFIGKRSEQQYLFDGLKERFESIIGKKITKWHEHGMNGRFQLNVAGEPIVYHCDDQSYAAMIFLTPNAPPESGTSTFRHRSSNIYHKYVSNIEDAFNYKTFLDKTPYDLVDTFGNVFNRLVIFDGGLIHGANGYFGSDFEDGRLWHMFFFDVE